MIKVLHQFLLASWAAAGLVTVCYGLVSDSPLPEHRLIVGVNDIVLHSLAFFTLTVLVFALWRLQLRILGWLFSSAIVLEFLQLFNQERTVSLRDVAASLSGVMLGAALFGTLRLSGRSSGTDGPDKPAPPMFPPISPMNFDLLCGNRS